LIEQKVKAGGKEVRGKKQPRQRATNVIDLVQVLQDSLQASGKSKPAAGAKKKKKQKRAASHTRAA
jgi:non-homologous end joining protein Ku